MSQSTQLTYQKVFSPLISMDIFESPEQGPIGFKYIVSHLKVLNKDQLELDILKKIEGTFKVFPLKLTPFQ